MNDEELSFRKHLADYSWALNKNAANNLYFTHQAQNMHALKVWDGTQRLIAAVHIAADRVKSPEAKYYVKYGLGRRSKAIWFSFRELYQTIPPERDIPLSFDDAERSSELLNSLYINIRGALDNVAWAFVNSLGGIKKFGMKETQIGLFSPQFQREQEFKHITTLLEPFVEWNKEFKRLRDPAAHRIPLTAIPSLQDSESLEEYARLQSEWSSKLTEFSTAAANGQHELAERTKQDADRLFAVLQNTGKYSPLFDYEPNAKPMPIYPTVPEDVGIYVIILRKSLSLLGEHNEKL
ncbi:MAG TPA: hypothetical protein P5337_14615 [Aestuariivirga sp.]|nr:hypothetical protein [Aestuariivirga sp.]